MRFALKIMGRSESDSAALCVRSGPAPAVIRVSAEEQGNAVAQFIREMQEKGYENIAILCKSAAAVSEALSAVHLPQKVAAEVNLKVLPIYLAKGLEFDAVAIWNADRETYGETGDQNLLYTAVTRAMHEVRLFYSGESSPFFTDC